MAQNSQTRQLQAILDAYTYCTSAFVSSKSHEVRKIHSYNDYRKLAKPHFWIFLFIIFSSSSVELAYRQSGPSILDGFYTKRLHSVAWVILYSERYNRSYLLEAIFCMCTCILERWGSSARVRGSRRGWGSCEHKQVVDGELHKEAEMDTERKTSETSVKYILLNC